MDFVNYTSSEPINFQIEPPKLEKVLSSDDSLHSTGAYAKNIANDVCDECGQAFVNSIYLWEHKEKHPGFHRFFSCCNVFSKETHLCVKVVQHNQESNLPHTDKKKSKKKKHLNGVELTSKPFHCNKCSFSFYRERGLKIHARKAHGPQRRCVTCYERFDNESEYQEHIKMHDPTDRVVCKHCFAEFSSIANYRIHARTYPGPHNFKCNECSRNFKTKIKLDDHVCIFINGQPLLCGCGLEFCKYDIWVEHTKGSRPYHCCSCDFTSITLPAFIGHVRKHTRQKPLQCIKCGLHFVGLDYLNHHISSMHNDDKEALEDESLSCVICSHGFTSEQDMKSHSATHKERVSCPDCQGTFNSDEIVEHREQHKKRSCLCPDCGRMFSSHARLSQHIFSTHNADPVTCDHCGKTLKTKKILLEHLKTHLTTEVGTRVAQAICPICGIELAQKGSLARHILLVHERNKLKTEDTPRICKECGMMLPNNAKYYSHRRQHRAMVERFPCSVCQREFNKKQNLLRHIYLLHDSNRKLEKPTRMCHLCHRAFREIKNLARHYRLVHKLLEFNSLMS